MGFLWLLVWGCDPTQARAKCKLQRQLPWSHTQSSSHDCSHILLEVALLLSSLCFDPSISMGRAGSVGPMLGTGF